MKNIVNIIIVFGVSILLTSCFNESRPNYQYFPNMYESGGYETYGEANGFTNGVEAQLPPENTIPRGWKPYDYKNTNEDYELAKAQLKNPLQPSIENLATGAALYAIYCAVCHGKKGDGQGILVKNEKFLGVPSYDDAGRAITEGSIYHVIYYGKNAMGSHAAQLNEKERWQVTQYVLKLKEELTK